MAERVVTLKLKVEDGEVVAATGSVNRLKAAAAKSTGEGPTALKDIETGVQGVDRATAAAAKRLGVSYDQMIAKMKATATASQTASNVITAVDRKRIAEAHNRGIAVEKAQKAEQELAAASDEAGTAFFGMSRGAAAAAAGVLAVVAVVALLIKGIYELIQLTHQSALAFAKYATDIGKAAEETGLMAKTVSGLRAEAERQGYAFDSLKGPIENFRKLIGQAAAGSDDARKRLSLLGLEASTAGRNVDGAFRQAVASIVRTKDPIEQSRQAFAAFGDEGYKLLPFFQSFNGDVERAIRLAEEYGIAIGDKDVKAAKEFNKAHADMEKQLQGLKNVLGREFLPVLTGYLQDFTGWLGRNKATITDWANFAVNGVIRITDALRDLMKFVDDHPVLFAVIQAGIKYGTTGAIPGIPSAAAEPARPQSQLPRQFTMDYGRPQSLPTDPAVLEAARKEAEKKSEELREMFKRDAEAAIKYTEQAAARLTDSLGRAFQQLKDQLEASGNIDAFQRGIDSIVNQYIEKISTFDQILIELERKKAVGEGATLFEGAALEQQQLTRTQGFADKHVAIQRQAEDLIKKTREKNSLEYLQSLEAEMRHRIDLSTAAAERVIENFQYEFAQGILTERQFIDASNAAVLKGMEDRKRSLADFLDESNVGGERRKEIEREIQLLTDQIDQQRLRNSRSLTFEEERRRDVIREIKRLEGQNANPAEVDQRRKDLVREQELSLKTEIAQLQDLIANGDINGPLIVQAELLRTILDLRNQELNATIAIMNSQIRMAESMKISGNQIRAQVYEHLAGQRTLNQAIADGITQTYDALGAKLDEQIDKMFSWAGAFKSLFTEPLKAIQRNALTNITTSLLDAFVPGLGQKYQDASMSPIAKPIVQKLDRTNQILNAILGRLGGSPVGGGLGGMLGGIGIGGGGSGIGGTPPFVPSGGGGGGFGGFGGFRIPGDRTGTLDANGNVVVDGRSVWGKVTGPGGLFGKEGFGNNVGTYNTIGAIGNLVGSAVGGRWGSALSGAASGLSLGATIGSIIPGVGTAIGAAVGAAAGFLIGLFGFSDPKRKRDKNEKIPALNEGFSKALKELNEILAGVRQLRIDPDEAVTRAGQVRAEIASGFGIQFESAKYRKEAQRMIAAKLTQADSMIEQITAASGIARGAADRRQRILPEFAIGHYFADYFKPNGLVPGAFDGADNILAMISRGEMVLNPAQQARVRALAGGDVFAGAGIPNYPRASSSPKLAMGGIAGVGLSSAPAQNIMVQPNVTVVLQGDTFDNKAKGYLMSDDGKRTVVTVIRDQSGLKRI